MNYKTPDYYALEAKKYGYCSRAAWKLIQIDRRFGIAKGVNIAFDLGCAPGSWLQVLRRLLPARATIVGVDLLPTEPVTGVVILEGDIETQTDQLKRYAPQLIVSDMAPNTSGVPSLDHHRSVYLCHIAFDIVRDVLQVGGNFVCKVFAGSEDQELSNMLRRYFKSVNRHKPLACRDSSKEFYIIAMGYKGRC